MKNENSNPGTVQVELCKAAALCPLEWTKAAFYLPGCVPCGFRGRNRTCPVFTRGQGESDVRMS